MHNMWPRGNPHGCSHSPACGDDPALYLSGMPMELDPARGASQSMPCVSLQPLGPAKEGKAMTCAECGYTIGWDCECHEELNALRREAEHAERHARDTESSTEQETSDDSA